MLDDEDGLTPDFDHYLPDFDGGCDRILSTYGEARIAALHFARSLGMLPRGAAGAVL